MDEVIASGVEYQGDSSFAQVFLFPWTEGHLVAQVNHKRIHAVAFDCDVHCLAFIYEGSDLLHHNGFVYGYGLCLLAHYLSLLFLLRGFLLQRAFTVSLLCNSVSLFDILCKSTDIFRYL